MTFEAIDRGGHIGNIECQMMAARVAVSWASVVLIRRGIFEQFDRRPRRQLQHAQSPNDRAGMDAEMLLHPVVFRRERTHFEQRLRAENVHKERCRGLQVRNGQAYVLDPQTAPAALWRAAYLS